MPESVEITCEPAGIIAANSKAAGVSNSQLSLKPALRSPCEQEGVQACVASNHLQRVSAVSTKRLADFKGLSLQWNCSEAEELSISLLLRAATSDQINMEIRLHD